MPITLRDVHSGRPPTKRNIASLVGGIVIAVGCFILWMLVATELTSNPFTVPIVGAGVLVALAIGIWIRLADL